MRYYTGRVEEIPAKCIRVQLYRIELNCKEEQKIVVDFSRSALSPIDPTTQQKLALLYHYALMALYT
jgi:hypothetical protein